eukprot:SAG22_NODE_2660_length_2329_cov_5.255157_2_plen_153_part_00
MLGATIFEPACHRALDCSSYELRIRLLWSPRLPVRGHFWSGAAPAAGPPGPLRQCRGSRHLRPWQLFAECSQSRSSPSTPAAWMTCRKRADVPEWRRVCALSTVHARATTLLPIRSWLDCLWVRSSLFPRPPPAQSAYHCCQPPAAGSRPMF